MNKSEIKISIIFPSYNGRDVLYENLSSIEKLSNLKEIELVIIDNNSNDNSRDIIKSFNNINIKLIEKNKNLGFAKACNIGAKSAQGEYLYITNQDVVFPNRFFNQVLEIFNKYDNANKEIILSPAIIFNGGKRLNYFGAKIHFLGFSYTPNMYQEIPAKKITFQTQKASGASLFLKKTTFTKLNCFDSSFFMYHEDTDLSLKAIRNNINIYTTNHAILHHQKDHFELNDFTYYFIERNRYFCLLKNIGSLKQLIPFIIIIELILLIHAFLIKKIKIRFKVYKFFIQNSYFVNSLKNSNNQMKLRKNDLSSKLDPIILGKKLCKNKFMLVILKMINLLL